MRSKIHLSRRDFLRLASIVPLTWLTRSMKQFQPQMTGGNLPNVIILVFDAWSAQHIQFYGYPRVTMPKLESFIEKATVFHNHYSAGTFTVPGTASLLTGMYPWTHRALSLGSGGIIDSLVDNQVFAVLSPTHSTLAYTQNKFADILLFQSEKYLDAHLKTGAFNLIHRFMYDSNLLDNDPQIAFASLESNILIDGTKRSSSLFINPLFRLWKMGMAQMLTHRYEDEYPLGLPDDTEQFLLSQVVDGAIQSLQDLVEPGFVYFHFYPPHENYRPVKRFRNMFRDGWQPPVKPIHSLSRSKKSYSTLQRLNQQYDEYIASWDEEVYRLFQFLQDSGLMERSYVVVTADHGELNERGERGHFTPLIYEPLIHIPLIIFQPGQKQRQDVYTYTNSIDVLPTLAHLMGIPTPIWAEGELLPGLGGIDNPKRSFYSVDAKTNAAFAPLTKISVSLTKNHKRLTFYGYPKSRDFEFYDLEEDREELHDLYPKHPAEAMQMKEELLQTLNEVSRVSNFE